MSSDSKKYNRLINATSPYLLQHANNPVDWFEWGEDALSKARSENKPILVSIGYSSCHWCHVMERESFEDNDIADIMNEHFISIKVDREERPDIDQIYMEAVQAMGINGGWPLNVFLTPDQRPFYGGTYFPPKNWAQLLLQLAKVYREKTREVNTSAAELTQRLASSDIDRYRKPDQPINVSQEGLQSMYKLLHEKYDKVWGGLDRAPKFVMPAQWMFLLRHYSRTGNKDALDMVIYTLKKMAMGGLYDQVGGGFARYSVDGRWFAPHFEKMLYDNAQLLSLYSEAYTITKDESFKKIVFETVEWLKREMTSAEGGFYSALDADSEGEEGKYYVWTKDDFAEAVGTKQDWIASYYNVTDAGNWEHGNNILFIDQEQDSFLKSHNLSKETFDRVLAETKSKLLEIRNKRVRPGLDDKILTGWNAMMIQGLCDSYRSFGEDDFLNLALKNIAFLERNLIDEKVYRSYREKKSPTEGFLEDYAFLIRAYLALYQATFDEHWISKANHYTKYVQSQFYDPKEKFFHFSSDRAETLIARKKEIFDNVIPSSNAVMARNLYHLGHLLDNTEYQEQAKSMVSELAYLITSVTTDMSYWGILYAEMVSPMAEIVLVSKNLKGISLKLAESYLPFSLNMGTDGKSDLPLAQGKTNPESQDATIYVCFNKTCKLPVHSVNEALIQIQGAHQ